MNCLDSENFQLNNSINKLYKLQNYLENFYYDNSQDIYSLFQLFNNIKEILGNFNTDVSFISCLMAKDYLCHRFTFNKFDVSEKSQSAPGLDIVVYTDDSKKIIGEIKTTNPYKENDFGAQQIDSLRKDFEKLKVNSADFKFLFVTNKRAFEILKRKYTNELPNINLVLLEKEDFNNIIAISEIADEKLLYNLEENPSFLQVLTNGFQIAYKKAFGSNENFIVEITTKQNNYFLSFYEKKKIVEDVYSEKEEIEIKDARVLNLNYKIGDVVKVPFDKTLFSKEGIIDCLIYFYQNSTLVEKNCLINDLENMKRKLNSENSTIPSLSSASPKGHWTPYFEEYKPYHSHTPYTKAEEEFDKQYGNGFYESGPDPFPFSDNNSEDDYGDDSWA